MLRLYAVFAALVAVAVSHRQSKMIDYDSCRWRYGTAGDQNECNMGEVAIGLCASDGLLNNCNVRNTGLNCCQMKHNSEQNTCVWLNGNNGAEVECTGAKHVHGNCGSAAADECGADQSHTFAIQCCESDVISIKGPNCGWVYGDAGDEIDCGVDRVMAGQCGSRLTSDCNNGDNTAGAYCCDIEERV